MCYVYADTIYYFFSTLITVINFCRSSHDLLENVGLQRSGEGFKKLR